MVKNIKIKLCQREREYLEFVLANDIAEMEGKDQTKEPDDYLLLCNFNAYVAKTIIEKIKEHK